MKFFFKKKKKEKKNYYEERKHGFSFNKWALKLTNQEKTYKAMPHSVLVFILFDGAYFFILFFCLRYKGTGLFMVHFE
jgi:hypothetical protein